MIELLIVLDTHYACMLISMINLQLAQVYISFLEIGDL